MKFSRTMSVIAPSVALLAFASPILAQEDPADGEPEPTRSPAIPEVPAGTPAAMFGAEGQIAISSDVGLSIEHRTVSGEGGSTTTMQLRPGLDYFIIDNLTIGGFLGLDYVKVPTGDTTSFALGPRLGYNIPFSPSFSVWPRIGFSFAHITQTTEVDPTGDDDSISSTSLALNLFAPVMFHPVEHFFLGFGPAFDVDLTGDVKATIIAARLTLGGWF